MHRNRVWTIKSIFYHVPQHDTITEASIHRKPIATITQFLPLQFNLPYFIWGSQKVTQLLSSLHTLYYLQGTNKLVTRNSRELSEIITSFFWASSIFLLFSAIICSSSSRFFLSSSYKNKYHVNKRNSCGLIHALIKQFQYKSQIKCMLVQHIYQSLGKKST